jgi:23S rRNA (cytosine1962-C5)-methyltransferase
MSLPIVRLKPLRPHRYGHPWIFYQEIAKLPETPIADGEWVQIIDHNGKDAGIGYFNSQSKIVVRRVSNIELAKGDAQPNLAWWIKQIRFAYDYRVARGVVARNCYRLIHAEGDGIPGLIADVYGDFVVVQLLTLGIDRQRDAIVKAIESVLKPEGIYERSDAAVRKLEGLDEATGTLAGVEPPDRLELNIDCIKALVDIKHGGKTGLFLDQIGNQIAAASEAKGREVLNVFSYTGLFGLRAACALNPWKTWRVLSTF